VVYGQPALAIAVNRFAETSIQPQLSKLVSFHLLNFRYKDSFTIQTLQTVKNRLIDQYRSFLNGECGIKEVLQTPFELALFAFINMFDHFNARLMDGLNIRTHSDIPIGCGMGSSAAVILSVLCAIVSYFKMPFERDHYLTLGYEAEKLQHGFPSGLDLYISLYGGSVHFQQNQKTHFVFPQVPMLIVNTGTPLVTTGQCVEQVKKHFEHDVIWDDFKAVTQAMYQALQNDQLSEIQRCVRENHRLLVKIGVVPFTVQRFIRDIEIAGNAAKICGAGAVSGEEGGIVLIVGDNNDQIQSICQRYGYKISPVQLESKGLRLV
jgi:mevalonate kinase